LPFVTVSLAERLCRDAQKGKRKIGKPSVPTDEDAMRAGGGLNRPGFAGGYFV
jgi:hypothetical protein